jgi:glycosyltransferase involved in cell wall biosynthesis
MHGAGQGGVEKSLKTLCKYLDKERFQLTVALPTDGALKAYLDDLGVKTYITPIDSWTPIEFHHGERHYYKFLSGLKERVRSLVDIIKQNEIDIVHSSTLSVADGAFAAKISGKPHIWHIHGLWGKTPEMSSEYRSYLSVKSLFALVNDLSTKIVAVSEDVRKYLETYISGDVIRVIYNGIDLSEFDVSVKDSSSIRDELNLNGKYVVAMVGRIAKIKGIEDYIEAAITVVGQRDNVCFLVVGPDEDKALARRIRNRVNSINLSDRIFFTGTRKDIPTVLRDADLFVCSSESEGFPYSCLEALSASKPIVTTKCGGPEEMVIDGVNGFHVNVGSADEIATSVISLIDDYHVRKDMGLKSRALVENSFSAEVFARNFEEIYSSLCNEDDYGEINPWTDVILHLTSALGEIGTKTRSLEHEVADLRNFERLFKGNLFYAFLKKLRSLLNVPSKN